MGGAQAAMDVAEMEAFLGEVFPQVFPTANRPYVVDAVEHGYARVRCRYSPDQLRPAARFPGRP